MVRTPTARAKVSLVNLNLVKVPAIAPYALDILGTALEDAGHEVAVLDLTRVDGDANEEIAQHFAKFSPDVAALTMRNNNDLYFPSYGYRPADGSFVPTHKALIDEVKKHIDPTRIIVGGVGFSSAPEHVLRHFGVRYGVRGPGEVVVPKFASAMVERGNADTIDVPTENMGDVVLFDGRRLPLQRRVRRTFIDNAWYYRYGGLGNLRTSNGCGMRCVYCSDPYAKGPTFTTNGVEDVLFEIDQLVEQGVFDLHTTDSEFNMPFKHAKALLAAIVERKYPKELRLWAYAQPKPWDEEYTRLLAAAGVAGMNLGTDHTDPEILKALGKWFTKEDAGATTKMCQDHGIAVMHELLFGYPGDTPDKMYRAIEYALELGSRVVGVTIGFAVTPGTPMAATFDALRSSGGDLTGYWFRGAPYINPVYYVSPAFNVPRIYDDLKRFVGDRLGRVMIPKPIAERDATDTDNQLVNSKRVEIQLIEEQRKGAYWYHYGAATP